MASFKNFSLIGKSVALAGCVAILFISLNVFHDPFANREEAILWGNQCLIQGYDYLSEEKLKKWDIQITHDLFVRFHKEYANGKREIYSFNLKYFNKVTHLGDTNAGALQISSTRDDIIKQTFHDPKGDVDTTLVSFNLNVRNISPAQVDTLNRVLNFLKSR